MKNNTKTKMTVPNKAFIAAATRQIVVLLPWPTEYIGEYGSGTFDGSPVTPEACDRVMDRYVSEVFDARGLVVTSIIAGRVDVAPGTERKLTKIGRGTPTPVIHVTVCERSLAEQIAAKQAARARYYLPRPLTVWAREAQAEDYAMA